MKNEKLCIMNYVLNLYACFVNISAREKMQIKIRIAAIVLYSFKWLNINFRLQRKWDIVSNHETVSNFFHFFSNFFLFVSFYGVSVHLNKVVS